MTENRRELMIYQSEDGKSRVQVRLEDGNAWLTQQQIAELFEMTKQNVSLHIQNIYEDGELRKEATVKNYLTVRLEGIREVQRELEYYNLDMIFAVGYRVRSPRGVQFRRWASEQLKEFITKGFVLDDERLKGECPLLIETSLDSSISQTALAKLPESSLKQSIRQQAVAQLPESSQNRVYRKRAEIPLFVRRFFDMTASVLPQRGRIIVRFVAPLQGADCLTPVFRGLREYAPPPATLFTPVGGKTQILIKTAIYDRL